MMNKQLLQKLLRAFTVAAFVMMAGTSWGQTAYTITRGFSSTAAPTGITITSYDGSGSCSTTANGKNRVTTLVLTAAAGYNFSVTNITGTGVRSGAGNDSFKFEFVNSSNTSNNTNTGTASTVASGSSCGTRSTISPLAIPTTNQVVTSGNRATIRIYQNAVSTSGGGYSHVYELNVAGIVSSNTTAPAITTTQILSQNITVNSATAGGNVTSNGGAALSAKGIVWNTATAPTTALATKTTITGTATGAFSGELAPLAANTHYYYRAYATNASGTNYGTEYNFYTLAYVPATPTVNNAAVSSLDVTVNANGNNAATQYAIRVNETNYVTASGTLSTSPVWQTAAQWGTRTIIGLTDNTTYSIDVKARNGANVETAFSPVATGTTVSDTAPRLILGDSQTQLGAVCLNSNATGSFTFSGANLIADAVIVVSPLDGYSFSLTENGVYTTSLVINNYTNGDIVTVWVKLTPTAVQSYNGSIAVAPTGGSSISVPVTGSGINTPGTVTTGIASAITSLSATLAAQSAQGICSTVSAYGIEYSTVNGFANGTGAMVPATNIAGTNYSVGVTGLMPATTYYYKAYATDGSGTYYGTQRSFITTAIGTPVTTTATDVTQTGFTANWTAVEGATGYRLDISTNENFGTSSFATDLFFSEYVEGSGNNKYLEIFNGTGATVNLSGYRIRRVLNGTASVSTVALSGSLAHNRTVIIQNGQGTIYTGAAVNYSAVTDFTGDDAIILMKSNGDYVDIFGNLNGTEWAGNGITENVTLRRKPNVNSGVTVNPASGFPTLATEWDVYPNDTADGLGSHVFNGGLQPNFIDGYNNAAVNDTSHIVTGLEGFTTYYYRVRAYSPNSTSPNSNVTDVITKAGALTWNGTQWSPTQYPDGTTIAIDATIGAIINGNYNTAINGVFTAKNITLNQGTFTVATGTTLTVENEINNNLMADKFVVEHDANLLQNNTQPDLNQDAITVYRNSLPLYRNDYSIWSSPVMGQNIFNFSNQTAIARFYTYDAAIDVYTAVPNVAGTNFEKAKGYLIRMPNGGTLPYNAGEEAMIHNGTFKGMPNNGDVTLLLSTAGEGYNAVGNPYPSTINLQAFLSANTLNNDIEGQIWLWRKKNNSSNTSYATMTGAGYVRNDAEGGGVANNMINTNTYELNTGQGFIVKSITGNLVFNNAMRGTTHNNPIFRNGAPTPSSRYWLNLTGANNAFAQIAVAYRADATLNYDNGLDGRNFTQGNTSFYSFADGANLAIQARPEFTLRDIVPVGFKTAVAGEYSIAIEDLDGLFTNGQDIIIKDNLLNKTHNLREGNYTFATEAGTFNNRFEIVYTTETTLGTATPVLTADTVIVYKQGNAININSGSAVMSNVTVYDMRGSIVYTKNGVNATETVITNLQSQQQVLIVQVTTPQGTVSKKIVF